MTGSALAAGRCIGIASRREVLKKREESEERGLKIPPDGGVSDDGKRLSGDGRCSGDLA